MTENPYYLRSTLLTTAVRLHNEADRLYTLAGRAYGISVGHGYGTSRWVRAVHAETARDYAEQAWAVFLEARALSNEAWDMRNEDQR